MGNLVCGQLADLVGRKPPIIIALLSMIILNIVAVFSTSWVMFATVRLFIGVAMGFHLTVQYSIMSEFTQARWRSWVIAMPSWPIETTIFALVAWLLHDWKWIHVTTAVIGVPFFFLSWLV